MRGRVWRASCAAGELDLVTRVAVTVRTATFYTRTKIRKLAAPSSDRDVIVAAALRVLDLFELDRPIRLLGVRLELEMPNLLQRGTGLGRRARTKNTLTWRIATLYGHHASRLNTYSAQMSGDV